MRSTVASAFASALEGASEPRRSVRAKGGAVALDPTKPATGLEGRDDQKHGGRLRVVHCIDNFGGGGTELNLVRTIERLDQDVFDLHLVALNENGPLRERVDRAGVPVQVFNFPSLGSVAAIRRAAQMIKWFRGLKPDVVHCHDRYTNIFAAPCARLAGVRTVITSRRWWTVSNRAHRVGNRLAYRISHNVLANSEAVADLLTESDGVARHKILVVPNFLDEASFEAISDEDRTAARRRFGVPDGSLVVTAVAVFRPVKDLETLILATASLKARRPALHVLLVGSGPSEIDLRRAAIEHGVDDRIHFAGYLPSPPNPHQYGDVSALCSLHEGFPNSIIEAMAAGRPVVATAVGGIPDAIQDGVNGFLVPAKSPADLAAAIERLIADPDLRNRMGRAGRQRAQANFAAKNVLENLAQMYLERQQLS